MNSASHDSSRFDRRQMVDQQLRARGVRDERVLAAMERVPRERFVRSQDQASAFSDRALPIDCEQTISQPYMVAAMTEAMATAPGHRVLEIGTGSGYQTAVLAHLVTEVYTIERIAHLQEQAAERLASADIRNVHFRVGDGSRGWPDAAPFDAIVVTAGAPRVPPPLINQLVDGGRLVIPVGNHEEQTLTVIERIGDRTREMPRFPCRFVKLVGDYAWPGSARTSE